MYDLATHHTKVNASSPSKMPKPSIASHGLQLLLLFRCIVPHFRCACARIYLCTVAPPAYGCGMSIYMYGEMAVAGQQKPDDIYAIYMKYIYGSSCLRDILLSWMGLIREWMMMHHHPRHHHNVNEVRTYRKECLLVLMVCDACVCMHTKSRVAPHGHDAYQTHIPRIVPNRAPIKQIYTRQSKHVYVRCERSIYKHYNIQCGLNMRDVRRARCRARCA